MAQEPPERQGIGIDYDPNGRVLQLAITRDDGKPVFVVLSRDDAISFVQAIVDTMGIGSNLLELDPHEGPPH